MVRAGAREVPKLNGSAVVIWDPRDETGRHTRLKRLPSCNFVGGRAG